MQNRLISFIKFASSRLFSSVKKINRTVVTIISISVTIIILGYLVYRQRDIILNYQWQFRPFPLLLSFIIFSSALLWVSLVWGWIINKFGIKLSYQRHIRYYIISNLAKRIPGTIWYLASRFQLYVNDGLNVKTTALASGVEMVLITLAGILVTLLFSTQTLLEYHISPFLLVLIFVIGLIIVHPKVIRWVLRKRDIALGNLNYIFILQGILAYIISWILGGIVLFETGNIIVPIPFINLPFFIASWAFVGILSTLLFFSPSNLGITEIGISLLLTRIVPSSIAVLIAISSRIIMIIFEIFWAGLFLWFKLPDQPALTQKD